MRKHAGITVHKRTTVTGIMTKHKYFMYLMLSKSSGPQRWPCSENCQINPHPGSLLLNPPNERNSDCVTQSWHVLPVFFYGWQTFTFALAKAKRNSTCLQQPCEQPCNLLVTYTTSDVQASFTQAASIYGQPAANSSTVTLHGPAQGAEQRLSVEKPTD